MPRGAAGAGERGVRAADFVAVVLAVDFFIAERGCGEAIETTAACASSSSSAIETVFLLPLPLPLLLLRASCEFACRSEATSTRHQ